MYATAALVAGPTAWARTIDLKLTVAGFEPERITAASGEAVTLRVTRVTDATCATDIVVPDANVKRPLPLNEPVVVELGVLPDGEHPFGCAMSLMIHGTLVVGHAPAKTPYAPPAAKKASGSR
jgi:plastocyanin domain-containing protein